MVECLVESSVECQVGSSANTHPTSNPLHKDVSDDLGWVLTKLLFFYITKKQQISLPNQIFLLSLQQKLLFVLKLYTYEKRNYRSVVQGI